VPIREPQPKVSAVAGREQQRGPKPARSPRKGSGGPCDAVFTEHVANVVSEPAPRQVGRSDLRASANGTPQALRAHERAGHRTARREGVLSSRRWGDAGWHRDVGTRREVRSPMLLAPDAKLVEKSWY
jgi:hypothetical protein